VDYKYPKAAPKKSPDGVKEAVEKWHDLPEEKKQDIPLLYWLLGTGTPAYKMSKTDSAYQEKSKGNQSCANCEFIYLKLANQKHICSQIRGKIEPSGWCRLWKEIKAP
jgi:hypothetical protein